VKAKGVGGGADDATGSNTEAQSAPAPDSQPHKLLHNGVCIYASVFEDNVDDCFANNFIVQQCLSRKATDDNLRPRRAAPTCRTPHILNNKVAARVNLYDRKVDCYSAGCVAFTAGRQNLTSAIYARLHVTEATASPTSKRLTGHCSPASE